MLPIQSGPSLGRSGGHYFPQTPSTALTRRRRGRCRELSQRTSLRPSADRPGLEMRTVNFIDFLRNSRHVCEAPLQVPRAPWGGLQLPAITAADGSRSPGSSRDRRQWQERPADSRGGSHRPLQWQSAAAGNSRPPTTAAGGRRQPAPGGEGQPLAAAKAAAAGRRRPAGRAGDGRSLPEADGAKRAGGRRQTRTAAIMVPRMPDFHQSCEELLERSSSSRLFLKMSRR